jgi:hypothetical protein
MPPTTQTEDQQGADLVRVAIDRAVERFGDKGDGLFNAAGFSIEFAKLAGIKGVIDGYVVRAILSGRKDVAFERDDSHYRRVPPVVSFGVNVRRPEDNLRDEFALVMASLVRAMNAARNWHDIHEVARAMLDVDVCHFRPMLREILRNSCDGATSQPTRAPQESP